MAQLTVRGIDADTHEKIKLQAKQHGLSVDRYVVKILREATDHVGFFDEQPRFHDLDYLAGTWSVEDAIEFEQAIFEQREIDEKM